MTHRQAGTITLVLIAFAVAQVALFVLFENRAVTDATLKAGELGQCYRVNVLRYQVNQRTLLHHLSHLYPYLPSTACVQAVAHPETYIPPTPRLVTRSQLKELQRWPPQPPVRIHGDTDRDGIPDRDNDGPY